MKYMKKLIALALVAMTVLAVAIPAMAATDMYVNVTPNVNFRKTASMSGELIMRINYRERVSVNYTTTAGGYSWANATYGGRTGFIRLDMLSYTQPSALTGHPQTKSEAFGTSLLQQSSIRKYEVVNLQKCLIRENLLPKGADDGVFGQQTFNAVWGFQSKYKYELGYPNVNPIDGKVGDMTKTVLWNKHSTYLMNNGVLSL